MNTGRNGTHSCLFDPSLKPTNSVIPFYQDIVQVACKNKYYYSFLHNNYTQLVVYLLPFVCLLFALSTLSVAIKVQQVFSPQMKKYYFPMKTLTSCVWAGKNTLAMCSVPGTIFCQCTHWPLSKPQYWQIRHCPSWHWLQGCCQRVQLKSINVCRK